MFDLTTLTGTVIVSCQAPSVSPLCDPEAMAAIAAAVQLGGASAIRANGPEDVAAIKDRLTIPVIGLLKRCGPTGTQWITPTMDDAQALADAGADVIAIDATLRSRDFSTTSEELTRCIHDQLGLAVVADTDTRLAAVAAAAAGANAVATTLSGYTAESANQTSLGPDLRLVKDIVDVIDIPVIAEGRYHLPSHVTAAFAAGATAVVVGAAITDPLELTRRFISAAPGSRL